MFRHFIANSRNLLVLLITLLIVQVSSAVFYELAIEDYNGENTDTFSRTTSLYTDGFSPVAFQQNRLIYKNKKTREQYNIPIKYAGQIVKDYNKNTGSLVGTHNDGIFLIKLITNKLVYISIPKDSIISDQEEEQLIEEGAEVAGKIENVKLQEDEMQFTSIYLVCGGKQYSITLFFRDTHDETYYPNSAKEYNPIEKAESNNSSNSKIRSTLRTNSTATKINSRNDSKKISKNKKSKTNLPKYNRYDKSVPKKHRITSCNQCASREIVWLNSDKTSNGNKIYTYICKNCHSKIRKSMHSICNPFRAFRRKEEKEDAFIDEHQCGYPSCLNQSCKESSIVLLNKKKKHSVFFCMDCRSWLNFYSPSDLIRRSACKEKVDVNYKIKSDIDFAFEQKEIHKSAFENSRVQINFTPHGVEVTDLVNGISGIANAPYNNIFHIHSVDTNYNTIVGTTSKNVALKPNSDRKITIGNFADKVRKQYLFVILYRIENGKLNVKYYQFSKADLGIKSSCNILTASVGKCRRRFKQIYFQTEGDFITNKNYLLNLYCKDDIEASKKQFPGDIKVRTDNGLFVLTKRFINERTYIPADFNKDEMVKLCTYCAFSPVLFLNRTNYKIRCYCIKCDKMILKDCKTRNQNCSTEDRNNQCIEKHGVELPGCKRKYCPLFRSNYSMSTRSIKKGKKYIFWCRACNTDQQFNEEELTFADNIQPLRRKNKRKRQGEDSNPRSADKRRTK